MFIKVLFIGWFMISLPSCASNYHMLYMDGEYNSQSTTNVKVVGVIENEKIQTKLPYTLFGPMTANKYPDNCFELFIDKINVTKLYNYVQDDIIQVNPGKHEYMIKDYCNRTQFHDFKSYKKSHITCSNFATMEMGQCNVFFVQCDKEDNSNLYSLTNYPISEGKNCLYPVDFEVEQKAKLTRIKY